MKEVKLNIEGMSCMHCVKGVEVELEALDLISSKVEIGSAEISFDENKTTLEQIKKAVEEAGYKVV